VEERDDNMGAKDVFVFAFGSLNREIWKNIVLKALAIAIESGFLPNAVEISGDKTYVELKWNGTDKLIKEIEKIINSDSDVSISVYGIYLSKYSLVLEFGFPSYEYTAVKRGEDLFFYVRSEDRKWLNAVQDDKKKLNNLLSAFTRALKVKVEEYGSEFDELALDEHGFVL